jgi:hypothetical protein
MYFVKILASEECARVWEYQESAPNLALSSIYEGVGSEFSSNLLSRLADNERVKATSELREALSELSRVKAVEISMSASKSRSTFWSLMSHLPLPLRRKLFRAYVRIYAIKEPTHYWNAHWR